MQTIQLFYLLGWDSSVESVFRGPKINALQSHKAIISQCMANCNVCQTQMKITNFNIRPDINRLEIGRKFEVFILARK